MDVHCIDCFHQKFAPRCFACHRPILPGNGQDETTRIVALDRNYHIDCYRCEVRVFFSLKEKSISVFSFRTVRYNLH